MAVVNLRGLWRWRYGLFDPVCVLGARMVVSSVRDGEVGSIVVSGLASCAAVGMGGWHWISSANGICEVMLLGGCAALGLPPRLRRVHGWLANVGAGWTHVVGLERGGQGRAWAVRAWEP